MKRVALFALLMCSMSAMGAIKIVNDSIKVSARGNYPLYDKLFYVQPADSGLVKDAHYQAFQSCVASYLLFNGAIETNDIADAELIVRMNYGLDSLSHIGFIDLQGYEPSPSDSVLMWETKIESATSMQDMSLLFPHMMYVSRHCLGTFRKTIFILPDEVEADVLYRWVQSGKFRSNSTYGFPAYEKKGRYAQQCHLHLAAVHRAQDATYVLIDYRSDEKCKFTKKTYIEFDHRRLYLRAMKGAKMNQPLPAQKGYILLEFDPIPLEIEQINIMDPRVHQSTLWTGVVL